MKSIYYLSLISVLLSCSKEEPYTFPDVQIKEAYIPEISEYTTTTTVNCACPATSLTLPDKYLYSIQYRFAEGFSVENKYYYKVERKTIEHYDTPSSSTSPNDFFTASDWMETNFYYRYDWQFKKAYLIKDDVNNVPLQVFDFNLKPGDHFNLTPHIDSADINIEVDSVYYQTFGDVTLPYIVASSQYYSKTQIFSFFEHNVFAFENNYLHKNLLSSINLPECIYNTPWQIDLHYYTYGPGFEHVYFRFNL